MCLAYLVPLSIHTLDTIAVFCSELESSPFVFFLMRDILNFEFIKDFKIFEFIHADIFLLDFLESEWIGRSSPISKQPLCLFFHLCGYFTVLLK